MSATDELRRMLDERGVKWDGWGHGAYGRGTVYEGDHDTVWTADSGDLLSVLCETTPEQAIDATLERGTCKVDAYLGDFFCSECGVRMFTATNYCPNCGRKVVE